MIFPTLCSFHAHGHLAHILAAHSAANNLLQLLECEAHGKRGGVLYAYLNGHINPGSVSSLVGIKSYVYRKGWIVTFEEVKKLVHQL